MNLLDLFLSGQGRVITDSRRVERGDIFFALKGENFDGNRFAGEAVDRGAILAITDDPVVRGEKMFHTDNALLTLQQLAGDYRRFLGVPLLAITGSNGKTTTRELIAAVLSQKFRVHSNSGNLNNHIGVPLTLLSAPRSVNYLIVEMGANHSGEIAELCNIAEPDSGIITNIGRAHLEGFGSPEGVLTAKSELYAHLGRKGGTIVCNCNNKMLRQAASDYGKGAVIIDYFSPGGNSWEVKGLSMNPGLTIETVINGEDHTIRTNLFGKQNLENVTAAVATGLLYGVPEDAIVAALGNYIPVNNRSQIMVTKKNRVVCDSYNANPTSMEEAINSFREVTEGKGTVILGDMLELGTHSAAEHRRVTDLLKSVPGFDVLLVGPLFAAAGNPATHKLFGTVHDLISWLSDKPIKDTFVLVKGSRGINLDLIYPYL